MRNLVCSGYRTVHAVTESTSTMQGRAPTSQQQSCMHTGLLRLTGCRLHPGSAVIVANGACRSVAAEAHEQQYTLSSFSRQAALPTHAGSCRDIVVHEGMTAACPALFADFPVLYRLSSRVMVKCQHCTSSHRAKSTHVTAACFMDACPHCTLPPAAAGS
jgi:hypothetical protein